MPDVIFSGPQGRLEGRYHHNDEDSAPVALILHPSPLQGGSMNNRITYAMYEAFKQLGFSVLRYNSSGVGKSQGQHQGTPEEVADAAAALDWLQSQDPTSTEIWVAGYSAGAYTAMQLLMRRPEIRGWVSVAPQTSKVDFGFLAPCPCNGLIIAAEDDSIVPESETRKLVEKLGMQKNLEIDYKVLSGCDHTLNNQSENVIEAIIEHVTKRHENENVHSSLIGIGRRKEPRKRT